MTKLANPSLKRERDGLEDHPPARVPTQGECYNCSNQDSLMSMLNLKSQKLQCPFCSTVSTRGTGLSSHIRSQHPREYGKWNKNPSRLLEAAVPASPRKGPKKNQPVHRFPRPVSVKKEAVPAQPTQEQATVLAAPASQIRDNDGSEAFDLLQKAYEQLRTRKQMIESELARIEGLRGEHEAVTAQVAALDQAIKAFRQ